MTSYSHFNGGPRNGETIVRTGPIVHYYTVDCERLSPAQGDRVFTGANRGAVYMATHRRPDGKDVVFEYDYYVSPAGL